MKTAGDVIKRLLWDADFAHGRQIVVWYHDRFEGDSVSEVGVTSKAITISLQNACTNVEPFALLSLYDSGADAGLPQR